MLKAWEAFKQNLGEDTFAVIEKWESKDALMAHAVSDHMKAYGKQTKDMVADKAIHIFLRRLNYHVLQHGGLIPITVLPDNPYLARLKRVET